MSRPETATHVPGSVHTTKLPGQLNLVPAGVVLPEGRSPRLEPMRGPKGHAQPNPPVDPLARVRFVAYGVPAPQGSKRHVGGGRMVESSKKVRPWREDVANAAREERAAGGAITGYVSVRLFFTLPKPASAHRGPRSKKPRAYPHGGDIDKLARSTLDALGRKKGAGLIEDDGKVVELTCRKFFPDEHEEALGCPGVRIEIRRLP